MWCGSLPVASSSTTTSSGIQSFLMGKIPGYLGTRTWAWACGRAISRAHWPGGDLILGKEEAG